MNLNKQQLSSRFNSLPEEIKKWLNSEMVGGTIENINNSLGLDGEFVRILPELILRLVVSEFPPGEFIENLDIELGGILGLSSDQLISITNQIEEKILRPIEPQLLQIGVDARMILTKQGTGFRVEGLGKPKEEILRRAQDDGGTYQQSERQIPVRTPGILRQAQDKLPRQTQSEENVQQRPTPPQIPRRLEVGQKSEPARPNTSTLEDRMPQRVRTSSGQVMNQENIITKEEVEKFRMTTPKTSQKEEALEEKPFVLHRNE